MAKKRAIVSYDKLTAVQRKELTKSFPDGYRSFITQIKTPAGESLEALIWETEEIIYLVKITNTMTQVLDDDDDDDEDGIEDDIIKPDDLEDEDEDEDDLPKNKSKKSSYDDEDDDDDDDDDEE